MKSLYTWLVSGTILFITTLSYAQSTADYFSEEGLSINSYHHNIYEGTFNSSFTYVNRTEEVDGEEIIEFIRNGYGTSQFFRIIDQKVYLISSMSDPGYLLYDFGVGVGDTFTEGLNNGKVVIGREPFTLLNGEVRNAYQIEYGSQVRSYVEGIGDISSGLVPNYNDFEGGDFFVCAKLGDTLLAEGVNIEPGDCEVYSCVKPIVDFEIELEELTVSLINNSERGTNYFWDFGDGGTSIEQNPEYSYSNPGCYDITLKVTNECSTEGVSITQHKAVCVKDGKDLIYANDSLSLSIYPFNDSIDYVYNREHLFKVKADGSNWEKLSTTPDGEDQRSLLTLKMWDENRGVAGCNNWNENEEQRSILVTEDGGDTWTSEVNGSYWIDDIMLGDEGEAFIPRSLYVRYFYRTLDYGQTWETVDFAIEGPWYGIKEFLLAKDNYLYAHSFKGSWTYQDYRLGISNDNGNSWSFLPLPFNALELQFIDENIGYGCDGDAVWKTTNGGQDWTKVDQVSNIKLIHMYNSSHGWYVSNSNVIYYTGDGFETSAIVGCGNERISSIIPITDSIALGIDSYFDPVTKGATYKYVFNISELGDCNIVIDEDNDGFSSDEDCDDQDASVHPGQEEIPYNGIDDDCDSSTLDNDLDQDGYLNDEDCDDQDALVNPGQEEIPYNGIDDDCDSSTLDDDLDQDGFSSEEDCDDQDALVNPGQEEIPYNGIDEDCDSSTLDDDLDQDGYLNDVDCDDNNALINPDAMDIPDNGIDEDCDGEDNVTNTIIELSHSKIKVFPNPAKDYLSVNSDKDLVLYLTIYDTSGKKVKTLDGQSPYSIEFLLKGFYFIEIRDVISGEKIVTNLIKI